MAETMNFDAATVLTITTGRMLCDIKNVYEMLGWMTDDNLFTRQLPRASRECEPWLARWFPDTAEANLKTEIGALDELISGQHPDFAKAICETWFMKLIAAGQVARSYDVPRIPADDHTRKDAYDVLVGDQLFGKPIPATMTIYIKNNPEDFREFINQLFSVIQPGPTFARGKMND